MLWQNINFISKNGFKLNFRSIFHKLTTGKQAVYIFLFALRIGQAICL